MANDTNSTANDDWWRTNSALTSLVGDLSRALGERLSGVLLYGPAVRGESRADRAVLNVLIVLRDLELSSLAIVGPVIETWTRAGQPFPRLVTSATLADAADVFPIELGEIGERHIVLHGESPFSSASTPWPAIDHEHLRLQCERELREKLMRLQEAYALGHRREAELHRLLVASYPTFSALFRACLRLHGSAIPATRAEATAAFCKHAAIDPAPFEAVELLRTGSGSAGSATALFARYHAAIEQAIGAIDRFVDDRLVSIPSVATSVTQSRSNLP